MHFEKPIIFRSLLSVVLGAAELGLFWMNQTVTNQYEAEHQDVRTTLKQIDVEVDTVLAHAGVERKWIRKQAIPLANDLPAVRQGGLWQAGNFSRIERRVTIPPEFLPLQLNAALNSMAHRYNGRAVGTEDLKQHTVTIHIEMQRVIVQTIILKTKFDLKRKDQQRKT